MNHLKRCKTSMFRSRLHDLNIPFQYCLLFTVCIYKLQAGGSGPLMSPLPTKLLMSWEDIGTDHPDVPALLSNPIFVNGNRLSQEPACRFSTVSNPKPLYGFRNLDELHQNLAARIPR